MTTAQRLRVPALVALIVLLLDQTSKHWIVGMWPEPPGGQITLIPWLLSLTYTRNDGVAFGMFQGVPQLFTVTSSVIILGLIYFYLNSLPRGHRMVEILVGLILGGAIGNVIDRIRLGYVIDFIKAVGGNFPIFNVADSAVSIGVVGLATYLFVLEQHRVRPTPPLRDDGHA